MKVAYIILLIIHSLIHILGFVKAFDLKEIKELTLPISKPVGIVWFIAGILFLFYAITVSIHFRYAWVIGLIALVISQILIYYFWKDARFGTIVNIAVALVVVCSFGEFIFSESVSIKTRTILSAVSANNDGSHGEIEMKKFPLPIRNWLKRSGILKRNKISSGRIEQHAFMKLKPEQEDWYEAFAVQYTTIDTPAFIWSVDVRMNSLLWFRGCDHYINGKGGMVIKANSLIPIVNVSGEKLDEGTIQRYLGEMVWFPTLAWSPYMTWQAIDSLSAQATMTYKGVTGSGTFYFNHEGDFVKFVALRYKDTDAGAKRFPWVLTVNSYKEFEGVRIPNDMNATWELDSGDFTWLKLVIGNVKYN